MERERERKDGAGGGGGERERERERWRVKEGGLVDWSLSLAAWMAICYLLLRGRTCLCFSTPSLHREGGETDAGIGNKGDSWWKRTGEREREIWVE
jgi:hypothetical protein